MKTIKKNTAFIIACLISSPTLAQEIIEIRTIPFEKRASNPTIYFCLEPSQIPDVYHGSGYSLVDVSPPAGQFGTLVTHFYVNEGIYLTSVDCLDDIKVSAKALGIDVENDLEYSYINP